MLGPQRAPRGLKAVSISWSHAPQQQLLWLTYLMWICELVSSLCEAWHKRPVSAASSPAQGGSLMHWGGPQWKKWCFTRSLNRNCSQYWEDSTLFSPGMLFILDSQYLCSFGVGGEPKGWSSKQIIKKTFWTNSPEKKTSAILIFSVNPEQFEQKWI